MHKDLNSIPNTMWIPLTAVGMTLVGSPASLCPNRIALLGLSTDQLAKYVKWSSNTVLEAFLPNNNNKINSVVKKKKSWAGIIITEKITGAGALAQQSICEQSICLAHA